VKQHRFAPGMISGTQQLIPWRGSEAGDVIPLGHSLSQHLANLLRQNDLRPFAGLASCSAARNGRCQVTVNFTGCGIERVPCDLSAIVDAECLQYKQAGVSRNEGVEVRHPAVLPQERDSVPVEIVREPNHLAFVVNACGEAPRDSGSVPRSPIIPFCQKKPCITESPGKVE
jgi:hypothetical protein